MKASGRPDLHDRGCDSASIFMEDSQAFYLGRPTGARTGGHCRQLNRPPDKRQPLV